MTKTISIRLDQALVDAIDEAGGEKQRGRSDVVREAVELWLRRKALEERVRMHREGYQRQPVKPEEFGPVLGAQTWPT